MDEGSIEVIVGDNVVSFPGSPERGWRRLEDALLDIINRTNLNSDTREEVVDQVIPKIKEVYFEHVKPFSVPLAGKLPTAKDEDASNAIIETVQVVAEELWKEASSTITNLLLELFKKEVELYRYEHKNGG